MSYFHLKKQIREKLINFPETKDNDNALIAYILLDMDFLDLQNMSAKEFLFRLKEGRYGSLESIRRCRQVLQEKNRDLRGSMWNKRHGLKDEIQKQLKFDF